MMHLIYGPTGCGKTQAILTQIQAWLTGQHVHADQIMLISGTASGARLLKCELQQQLGDAAAGLHATSLKAWALSVLRAHHLVQTPNEQPFSLYCADLMSRLGLGPEPAEAVHDWLDQWGMLRDDAILSRALPLFADQDRVLSLFPYRFVIIDNAHHLDDAVSLALIQAMAQGREMAVAFDPFLAQHQGDLLGDYTQRFPNARVSALPHRHHEGPVFEALCEVNPALIAQVPTAHPQHPFLTGDSFPDEEALVAWMIQHIRYLQETQWIDGSEMVMISQGSSPQLEAALHLSQIPTRHLGEDQLYQTPELVRVLAYLSLIHNPHDPFALLEVSESLGVDRSEVQAWISAAFHAKQSVSTLCQTLKIDLPKKEELQRLFTHLAALQTAYYHNEHRLDELIGAVREVSIHHDEDESQEEIELANANVSGLVEEAMESGWTLQGLLDYAQCLTPLEDRPAQGSAILVIDASMAWMLQDLHPHRVVLILSPGDADDHLEATYYLGLGHAKNGVVLTHLSTHPVDHTRHPWFASMMNAAQNGHFPAPQDHALRVGQRVRHATWGEGKITQIQAEADKTCLHVQFHDELRVLMAKYAVLDLLEDG